MAPPLIDQLLLPQRIAQRGLSDLARIADAAVQLGALAAELRPHVEPMARKLDHAVATIDELRDEVAGLHEVLKPMSEDLDGLREAFNGSNEQLAKLREAMTPELRGVREAAEPLHRDLALQREDIADMREVVEPLQPAAERVGRLAERLPGSGRKR